MRNKPAVLAIGMATACVLAACGSSSGDGKTAAQPSAAASAGAGAAGGPSAGRFGPAASGKVAAISGTTMQVQNQQSGQVAVTWTPSTKFRHAVTTTPTSIKAGDCVVAIAPSGSSSSATTFTATSVSVTTRSTGTCGGFGRGGSGQRPPGQFPSHRPSGFPGRQRPSGSPGSGTGRPKIGAFASGKVTSVTDSAVVVAAQGGRTPKKTVRVGPKTKVTTEAATASGSVKVGVCITAQGKADSSGKVTATSVQITSPTGGRCGSGAFGRSGIGG